MDGANHTSMRSDGKFGNIRLMSRALKATSFPVSASTLGGEPQSQHLRHRACLDWSYVMARASTRTPALGESAGRRPKGNLAWRRGAPRPDWRDRDPLIVAHGSRRSAAGPAQSSSAGVGEVLVTGCVGGVAGGAGVAITGAAARICLPSSTSRAPVPASRACREPPASEALRRWVTAPAPDGPPDLLIRIG